MPIFPIRTIALAALFLLAMQTNCVLAGVGNDRQRGAHGFDFLFGTWRTHYQRLGHVFANAHDWYGCSGTSVVRPFWNGSANVEDGDLHCPHQYIGGMTLRLYNATTRRWSIYWGTKKRGLVMPPQVGAFNSNGVGDFFASDSFAGKPIVVRYRWTLRAKARRTLKKRSRPIAADLGNRLDHRLRARQNRAGDAVDYPGPNGARGFPEFARIRQVSDASSCPSIWKAVRC